jgi:dipeptidyl aminopeptidase/acylaminoacyl peptidase
MENNGPVFYYSMAEEQEKIQKYIIKQRFATHRHIYEEASPVVHARRAADHVPFFVAHGDRDILVPLSEAQ